MSEILLKPKKYSELCVSLCKLNIIITCHTYTATIVLRIWAPVRTVENVGHNIFVARSDREAELVHNLVYQQ